MHSAPRSDLGTHEVSNQPTARPDTDLWDSDVALRDHAILPEGLSDRVQTYARTLGRQIARDAARDANRHAPELLVFDPGGRRLDEVKFHPAYHEFMATSVGAGYTGIAWQAEGGSHVAHAAMVYLASQVEPGHCCPLTMTHAAVPLISGADGLAETWRPKLVSRHYDPTVRPLAAKAGATLGMAMTEKQGGSDVRATTTRAEPDGPAWRLTGHKWFCSAPMSDGFLTLAQGPDGLTCYLVPRWLDEERNGIRLQRLKDKLGNRSNASAEIEYDHALAWQVGAPGRGIATIVEMVHQTRLDTAMAPVGLMRAALVEAHHWVSHRTAFQRRLIDQPLMQTVLADLSLDWEGALALAMRVARAFEGQDEADRAFARIGVAVAKFLNNKLCPMVVGEAMEVLGGMGYVEDTPLPMLYREAPLNGIWEGSGNVICLDVLRSLAKDPLAHDVLQAELSGARGHDTAYDAALDAYQARWRQGAIEADARWFTEQTALLLSAAALIARAPAPIAQAYVATRLSGARGRVAGSLRAGDVAPILARLGPSG